MAALHQALESLGPTPFSSVPTDHAGTATYLQNAFQQAQTIIDSVPLPPVDSLSTSRPRSLTNASVASNISEISASSARSDPIDPSNVALQKEWGKPLKLNAKENPLGISVYKCSGKDGKGAWFARRSVHEGLGFKKWKLGIQNEFFETLKADSVSGEGNVRGIGAERQVESIEVGNTGKVDVFQLAARFSAAAAPRDFVTLLLTSSSALGEPATSQQISDASKLGSSKSRVFPRHHMVISRPCIHSDCPPRDGFVRAQYESVEFIREIPRKSKPLSSSTTNLLKSVSNADGPLEKDNLQRKPGQVENSLASPQSNENLPPKLADNISSPTRKRGSTISFSESRGFGAKGEALDNPHAPDENETNPVEWIMVTRSDPGGNIPRFLVEGGTPKSIVADAGKFLDWACKKDHEEEIEGLQRGSTEHVRKGTLQKVEEHGTNGYLPGFDGPSERKDSPSDAIETQDTSDISPPEPHQQGGLLSSMADAAYASIETYAPQVVIDRLPRHQLSQSLSSIPETAPTSVLNDTEKAPLSPVRSSKSSIASFASAEEHVNGDDDQSIKSGTSQSKSSKSKDMTAMSQHEKELQKLNQRKTLLNEKLAKAREKETKDKEELTAKEEERIRKAEEKHAKEVQKQEEKYKNQIAKLEAKRAKEAAKMEDRRKKVEDRDEKARLAREKEEMRQELEVLRKERDILRDQVAALQKENTSLVMKMGKAEMVEKVEGRSRSSSLRRLGLSGKGEGSMEGGN